MDTHPNDRLFAAFGVGSVILELLAFVIGAIGGRPTVTVTSSPAQIAAAVAKPVTTAAWVGAYLELLSFGLFLAFSVWACGRLGGGLLGSIGRAAATGYVTLSITSLGVGDAIMYRAGHGLNPQLATAMITVNEALYICTWFLIVFFLLAVAPLALDCSRRLLGWGAVGVAAVILLATAVSFDSIGQMSNFLWLIWIICASVSLGRTRTATRTDVEPALA